MNKQKHGFLEENNLMESAPGAETTINGIKYLYFGGTSYFGLHNHPAIIQSATDALKKYGMNSATSRNGFGTTPLILEAEKKAAEYFGTEDAVFISSGYLSDMAGIQALSEHENFDVIFMDEISHYSNRDAAFTTRKPVCTFYHLDSENLKKKIDKHLKPGQKPLLITDGIFPVFGKIAPIPDYLDVLEQYNGIIWIDDAHALGILGPNGRGTCDYYNINSDRIYFGGTLAKAFGAFGGIIPGTANFIKIIRNGSVINGASAPPTPAVAAGLTGMELVMNAPEKRTKLWQNARQLKSGLKRIGFDAGSSLVPIAAWTLQKTGDMKRIYKTLMEKKIAIQYTNYIGADAKGALRAVVFSTHTTEQIDLLINELEKIIVKIKKRK